MQINIFNMMYMENECPKDTKVDQMKKNKIRKQLEP